MGLEEKTQEKGRVKKLATAYTFGTLGGAIVIGREVASGIESGHDGLDIFAGIAAGYIIWNLMMLPMIIYSEYKKPPKKEEEFSMSRDIKAPRGKIHYYDPEMGWYEKWN